MPALRCLVPLILPILLVACSEADDATADDTGSTGTGDGGSTTTDGGTAGTDGGTTAGDGGSSTTDGGTTSGDTGGGGAVDEDGDGYTVDEDCDDDDADVNPGATEICGNDIDDNCDGASTHCEWSGSADLSAAAAKYTRPSGSALGIGNAVAFVDHDGDGVSEVLVGASGMGSTTFDDGVVYLMDGSSTGELDVAADAVAQLGVSYSYSAFGSMVASGGDVDGDGDDALLLSGFSSTSYNAVIYVIEGPVSGSIFADSDAVAVYEGVGAGGSVKGMAHTDDIDGDGLDDLVFGANFTTSAGSDGTVWLVPGTTSGTVDIDTVAVATLTGCTDCRVGNAVAALGDVDGDGVGDLLAGGTGADTAGEGAGAAWLIDGTTTGTALLDDVATRLDGLGGGYTGTSSMGAPITYGDLTGYAVSAAGDVDNDGYADMLIAAPYAPDSSGGEYGGVVYLVSGPSPTNLTDATATLRGEGLFLGTPVGMGDLDGDGADDIAVGTPHAVADSSLVGAAYVLYGPVSGTIAVATDSDAALTGQGSNDGAGTALAGGADADGDGVLDFLIGAPAHPYNGSSGSGPGAVYMVSGATW